MDDRDLIEELYRRVEALERKLEERDSLVKQHGCMFCGNPKGHGGLACPHLAARGGV